MIERELIVKSYDVFPNSTMKPSATQHHMQQSAREDCDGTGCTYVDMRNVNMVFVMTKMGIKVNKPVFAYDELTVRTYNNTVSGITFVREFEFYRGDEEVIHATTQWVIIKYDDRTIVRPRNFPFEIPAMNFECASVDIPRNIDISGIDFCEDRRVRLSDLDENDHLNNCVYSDISLDIIPYDRKEDFVSEIRVIYRHEAKINDVLKLSLGEKDGRFVVSAHNSTTDTACFEADCVLEKISG